MRVNVSDHAYYDRWLKYCGYMKRTKLAALVERHLFEYLRQGAEIRKAAIHVNINSKMKAVVVPGKFGGWDVKTFLLREKAKSEVLA